MIIGIAGTIGAGKGTVVEYLQTKKGFIDYSSSGTLKEILTERGLPLTREHMSKLADELSAQREGGILAYSHERAQKDQSELYILESIHRVSEAEYVRSVGGIILGVDADLKVRYDRTQKRGEGAKDEVTFDEFAEHSRREDEGATGSGPNIKKVLEGADYIVTNNGSLDELYAQVDEVLEKIEASQ